jgi:hypothetical protein
MRLLLDESVPGRLGRSLPNHAVRTVVELGWSGVTIGKLLSLAAAADFDAFVTVDKNLPQLQNMTTLPIAVIVLDGVSIELPALMSFLPYLERELSSLRPKTYMRVATAR